MIFDILVCLLIVFWGFNFKNRFTLLSPYDRKFLNILFIYHIIIGVLFDYYISNFGGDANMYWFLSSTKNLSYNDILSLVEQNNATGYMLFINYIPVRFFELSFFTGNIIYNVIGFIGFIYFYLIIKENIPEIEKIRKYSIFGISIFPTVLFLPNLHFWAAGIGKDTILFVSIALFIYSIKKVKHRYFALIISLLLSITIRPHITLFLIAAFSLGFVLDRKFETSKKVLLFVLVIVGFGLMMNYVLSFIQLESLDSKTIQNYSDTKSSQLAQDSGSAVDVSSYPYPLKVFTFLYRPLFIDGFGVLNIVASFENLLLLLFTIKILGYSPIKAFRKGDFIIKGLFIFFIIGSLTFSLILGNLGIMLRQKAPFVMTLLIFGFWVMYSYSVSKEKRLI